MSLAAMIGVAVGLIVALTAMIYLFGRQETPGAVGSVLRWLTFAITPAPESRSSEKSLPMVARSPLCRSSVSR